MVISSRLRGSPTQVEHNQKAQEMEVKLRLSLLRSLKLMFITATHLKAESMNAHHE